MQPWGSCCSTTWQTRLVISPQKSQENSDEVVREVKFPSPAIISTHRQMLIEHPAGPRAEYQKKMEPRELSRTRLCAANSTPSFLRTAPLYLGAVEGLFTSGRCAFPCCPYATVTQWMTSLSHRVQSSTWISVYPTLPYSFVHFC